MEECENIKVANFTITGGNAASAGCIGGGGILVTHPDLEYVYDGPVSPVNAVFENLIVTDNTSVAGSGISIIIFNIHHYRYHHHHLYRLFHLSFYFYQLYIHL